LLLVLEHVKLGHGKRPASDTRDSSYTPPDGSTDTQEVSEMNQAKGQDDSELITRLLN